MWVYLVLCFCLFVVVVVVVVFFVVVFLGGDSRKMGHGKIGLVHKSWSDEKEKASIEPRVSVGDICPSVFCLSHSPRQRIELQ